MKLNDYVRLALRTESVRPFDNTDHGRRASRLAHASLGIVTEIGELHANTSRSNYKEELGDVCWYLAVLADEFDFQLEPVATGINENCSFGFAVDKIADQAKRTWFYNQPASPFMIRTAVNAILGMIAYLAARGGFTLEQVLEANIRKLQTRFPDKFTDAAAAVRDTNAEAKALEA